MPDTHRRRTTPTSELIMEFDGDTVSWATKTYVSQKWLDALAESRKANRRAPLGDPEDHRGYVKVAEVPLALAFQAIPHDAWEDKRAWKKLLDDPQWRKFRTDSDTKRY